MSRIATLLTTLRGVKSSQDIRSDMVLRCMLMIREHALQSNGTTVANSTAAVAAAPASSGRAIVDGVSELLQLDAPAVLLHVARTYTEDAATSSSSTSSVAATAATAAALELRFEQVQLACVDVLLQVCTQPEARATIVREHANDIAAHAQYLVNTYAASSSASTPASATASSGASAANDAAAHVPLITALLSLASVLLSEAGSAAIFRSQQSLWLSLTAALQTTVGCTSSQTMHSDTLKLHAAGLTFLLLLQQHADDARALTATSDAATMPVDDVFVSRRFFVDTLLRSIAPALLLASSSSAASEQTGLYLPVSVAVACRNWCALVNGCMKRIVTATSRLDAEEVSSSSSSSSSEEAAAAESSSSLIAPASLLQEVKAELCSFLFDLLATSCSHSEAAPFESQALLALRTLFAHSAAPRAGCSLERHAIHAHTLLSLLQSPHRTVVDTLQSAMQLMQAMLRSDARLEEDGADSSHSSSDFLSLLGTASDGSLSVLLDLLLRKVDASPSSIATHIEADAWNDVQTLAVYALATLLQAQKKERRTGQSDQTPNADVMSAVVRALPIALKLLHQLAVTDAVLSSSSGAVASSAAAAAASSSSPIDNNDVASAHRALSSLLYVLASCHSYADACLRLPAASAANANSTSGGGCVALVLSEIAACHEEKIDAAGEVLARPAIVFLLRVGARASSDLLREQCLTQEKLASLVLQPLFDALPSDSSLGDIIADVLLMIQGKASAPLKYSE